MCEGDLDVMGKFNESCTVITRGFGYWFYFLSLSGTLAGSFWRTSLLKMWQSVANVQVNILPPKCFWK